MTLSPGLSLAARSPRSDRSAAFRAWAKSAAACWLTRRQSMMSPSTILHRPAILSPSRRACAKSACASRSVAPRVRSARQMILPSAERHLAMPIAAAAKRSASIVDANPTTTGLRYGDACRSPCAAGASTGRRAVSAMGGGEMKNAAPLDGAAFWRVCIKVCEN